MYPMYPVLAMKFNTKGCYFHNCNSRQATVKSARGGPGQQLQQQVNLLSATRV